MTIADYMASITARLLSEPAILSFRVLRERTTSVDAYVRVRLTLRNDTWLEFGEYVQIMAAGQIETVTYTFHWADSKDNLIRRWDNTPHYPHLKNSPHHIHNGSTGTVEPGYPVNIFVVLDEILKTL